MYRIWNTQINFIHKKRCLWNTNAPPSPTYREYAWSLILTFRLLIWILIRVIYSSRTIYLPSLKLLGQTVLELSVAKGVGTNITFDLEIWPFDLNIRIDKEHLIIMEYLPTKFESCGESILELISCTTWSILAWPLTYWPEYQ